VEFGAALVVYKETMGEKLSHSSTCTVDKVKEKTISYFQANYPNLLPRLQELINAHFEFLYWTGPKLSISRRTDDHRFFSKHNMNTPVMTKRRPLRDFIDAPLYPPVSYDDKENGEGLTKSPPRGTTDLSHRSPQPQDSTEGSTLAARNPQEVDGMANGGGGSNPDSSDPFHVGSQKQTARAGRSRMVHFQQADDDGGGYDHGFFGKKALAVGWPAQLSPENSRAILVRESSKLQGSYSEKQTDDLEDPMDVDSESVGGDDDDGSPGTHSSPISSRAGSIERPQEELEAAVIEEGDFPARNLRRGPRQVRDLETGRFPSHPKPDGGKKAGPLKGKPPTAKSQKGEGGKGKGFNSSEPNQSSKGKKRPAEAPAESSQGAKRPKASKGSGSKTSLHKKN